MVTPKERQQLVRFARKLGKALHHLTTIVRPKTLLGWIRAEKKNGPSVLTKRGQRRTPEQVRRLILKLSMENQWGYTRIVGELRKLGIRLISRNTVKRILKDAGFDPAPKRGEQKWDEFLHQHAASLWQCDFFSKRIVTLKGIRQAFVLVFLNVKTRRVIVSPATLHPDESWVVAQAEAFAKQAREQGLPVTLVQRDRDSKFAKSFDGKLKSQRVKVIKNPIRAPNTNAYVERFVGSITSECLDHFIVFGESHLNHLCAEYLAHYHEARPHQGLDNELLVKPKSRGRPPTNRTTLENQVVPLADVRCKQRLGGLLKSYSRRAA